MKRVFLMSIVIIIISSFANAPTVSCDKSILTTIIEPIPSKGKLSKENFIKLRTKDFEKYSGKKLTLKEKIAFKIVQYKLKKVPDGPKAASASIGKTALILSIIGLALVFVPVLSIASIPLSIIAINMGKRAKKIDPFDKKARTAVVLGWVTVGLLIVLLITAVIFISMMSFNFYII